jgi:hypothetical protein
LCGGVQAEFIKMNDRHQYESKLSDPTGVLVQ